MGVVFRKFEKKNFRTHTKSYSGLVFLHQIQTHLWKKPKRLVPFSHDKPTRNSHKRVAEKEKIKYLGLKFTRHLFFLSPAVYTTRSSIWAAKLGSHKFDS